MLQREISNRLILWKKKKNKKALCVIGARQIGKTTIIRKFAGENYENFVEINFILDKGAERIFSGKLDANTIIENITAFKRQKLEPGKTLIFLDEIQECPNARCAIKFLQECYQRKEKVPEAIHETMLKLFFTYIVVGGMPDVVQTYVNTHDIGSVIQIQREILELYRLDISKYAENNEKIKVKAIFDSIPAQLDDKKRRFILNKIDANGRMNRYENAFLWLSDAGVALPSYNVTEPQAPLQLNEKRNLFKLFMGDTGLLCAACMENIQFELLQGNMEVNMGSILENMFAQAVKCNGFSLNYFESKKYGELDFVIQNGLKVDLLEIKSGNDYMKHSALKRVSNVENWKFGRKLVFCKGNVETEDTVEYLPWYMVMFYKPEAVPENLIYQVDLSGV